MAALDQADAAVARLVDQTGGTVQQRTVVTNDYASFVCRVPAAALTELLDHLPEIGTVERKSLQSTDVTGAYVDLDARLRATQALHDRLTALLQKAANVEDTLAIEKELGRVQGELESMQARMTALRATVDSAVVNITLRPTRVLGPLGYLAAGVWWMVEKLFVIK